MSTASTSVPTSTSQAIHWDVLLVDGDGSERNALAGLLRAQFGPGLRIWEADSGQAAQGVLRGRKVDVALIDCRLPDMDALELLAELTALKPHTAVVLLAGPGGGKMAAEAIKRGAKDYLIKEEISPHNLRITISRVLQAAMVERERARTFQQLCREHGELDHFVRALSHDMSANFMLLDNSFARLKKSLNVPARSDAGQLMDHVEACLRESKQFLDDMVLLARTGRVQMEPDRVEVAKVVREVLFEQHEIISAANIRVVVEEPLPVVWCNRQRVKQVVSNLVRNAVKHGCNPHHPRITISPVRRTAAAVRTDGPPMVLIRIHDNGPGIDPQFREEIFLPGRRLPQSASEGSGMGLAIVKRIVEYYGGTVEVDSACRAGTAVVVTLPAAAGRYPADQADSSRASDFGDPRQTIESDGPHGKHSSPPHRPFSRRRTRHGRS